MSNEYEIVVCGGGILDGKAKLDARGALVTDATLATNLEGIFAAGGTRDGAAAAIAAVAYLNAKT